MISAERKHKQRMKVKAGNVPNKKHITSTKRKHKQRMKTKAGNIPKKKSSIYAERVHKHRENINNSSDLSQQNPINVSKTKAYKHP